MSDALERLRAALADRYAIERELGRGGMATVFLARDLRHDRPVALKVLHAELAATLGPERFQREIRMAARLQHPHILTVHDSGEIPAVGATAPTLWFTMPFVEGESLRDRLRRERQLPLADAVRIAREAASALDYAHRHDVIHRDIKPENLLLTADGQVLVADFGIARALGGGQATGGAGGQETTLTETGTSIGTPAYMSPEQASGERALDGRTDIYSLGVVLYEMLAGEPPFTGPTAQAIIAKRFTGEIPALRKARPSVPEEIDRAVSRALAMVPADRLGSAAEFAAALETGRATAVAPPPAIRPSAHRIARPLTAALVLGFILGVGVLFAWRRSHGGDDPSSGAAKTIAVLPFDNLGSPEDEYFSDGMTDEVRGKLANLSGLRVTARSSSSEYKKTNKRPQEIGRELGVDYLLTGTVRWEKGAGGSRARVSPELIEVATGATTWQQPFDAKLTDVFQVQADIAGRVADALNLALGSTQKETLAERPTANLAAYDAYLKGEAATIGASASDPGRLGQGIDYYEQAVALDSTFLEAWVQLARAHAARYYGGTPDPADAAAARRSADRASALAPGRADGRLALGDYYSLVLGDPARALAEYEAGLKVAPEKVELLVGAAFVEQSLGRWDAALTHLERARALDPRSLLTARRLATTLLWLRRYPDAAAAADRALGLAPAQLQLLEIKTQVHLAQGDLEGARNVVRSAPAEIAPTALAAFYGTYWDLYWVLDDAQQQLLLRLAPSAFGGDRGNWAIVLAQTHHLRGNLAAARIYADSARLAFEEQLRGAPDDSQRLLFLGLSLAYLGRRHEAIRAGEKGLALQPISRDGYSGPYNQHLLARIYLLLGEPENALDQLEPLLKMPYYLSAGWLRIDPTFDALRKHPRFQRLVKGAGTS